MRHLWGIKPLNRFAMKTQFLFLTLVIFSCIVKAQDVSVSDKFVVFQGHVFLSGGWRGETEEDSNQRSASFVPIDAVIDNGVLSIDFWDIVDNVTITISREDSPEVYSKSLFVNETAQLTFSINTYTPGIYLLELSNPDGGYVSGWFEVK